LKSGALILLNQKIANVDILTSEVGLVRKVHLNQVDVYFVGSNRQITLRSDQLIAIDIVNYGDEFPEKICNICHIIYPTADFDKNQNAKDNRTVRRPSCKKCRKVIDGLPIPGAEKRKWNSSKPTNSDFQCPICKKITIAGLTAKVVLNHDHKTGKPTGWICDSCNTGLGRFKDDISILEEAIRYLKKNHLPRD
jgi:hypothetical protein